MKINSQFLTYFITIYKMLKLNLQIEKEKERKREREREMFYNKLSNYDNK